MFAGAGDAWLTRAYERYRGRYVLGLVLVLCARDILVTIVGSALLARYVGNDLASTAAWVGVFLGCVIVVLATNTWARRTDVRRLRAWADGDDRSEIGRARTLVSAFAFPQRLSVGAVWRAVATMPVIAGVLAGTSRHPFDWGAATLAAFGTFVFLIAAGLFTVLMCELALRPLRQEVGGELRGRILLELGRVEMQADDVSALEYLGQAAELATGGEVRAEILFELAQALLWTGAVAEALPAFRRALDAAPADAVELRLQIGAEMFAFAQMDVLAESEVDALAGQLGVGRFRERLLEPGASSFGRTLAERRIAGATAFFEYRRGGSAPGVLKLARIALDNGDLPAPEAVGTMSTALAVLAMIACDELQPPRRLAASTTEWARAQGAPGLYAMHAYWLALIAQHEGDLRSVEAACSAAVDAGSGGAAAPLVAALVAPCRSEAEIERGRVEAARVAFDATGLADVPVEQMPIATPLYTRGRILRAEGQLHAALEDFIACGERLKWHGNRNPSLLLPWRFHAAQLHLELGERDKANAIAEENLQLARQFGAASSVGVALQLHGSILGGDAGLAELHEAVKLLGASPARLAHAKALVDLGATLRRSGQRRLARDALRRGMELAAECDASPIAARAEDELRASGARLLGRPVTGIDALTPSEHRVASLAASGHTNPQIAQSLFLSLKTVEMHLGRTYRKLGIKSREQLGDALTATPDDQPERKQASA